MVCVPGVSVEVLNVAWPFVSVTGAWAVPSTVKATVPVGVPEPGATAATVAVNVTAPPEDGLAEDVTVVVVLA
jgi:hypothetical protein